MSTLADELLQDFEDSGSENENEERQDDELGVAPSASSGLLGNGNGLNDMDVDDADDAEDDDEEMNGIPRSASDAVEDAEDAKAKVEKMQLGAVDDVRSVASLMQTLEPVLEKIAQYQSQPAASRVIGNIEDHPEYHLLTQSNSLSTLIDGEIILVHKYIRDHYSIRFPELETLITNPVEYAKVVSILGNGPLDSENIKALQTSTDNPLKSTLKSVLDGPSLMIVTVEATTSKGREMSADELARVFRAAAMVLSLEKAKKTLTDYVQSRMNLFAPNLTVLIGSLTAAQLLNAAGGLTGLSKTPACNIAAWGSKKGAGAAGMATNIGIRQQGFLYHSSIVQGIPNDLKKQAMRIVSAKLVLAARNRMAFGKEEREVGYGTGEGTVGMGMIGQGSEGKIRNLQVDQRTRAKLSAKNKGWGAASSLGGAASSFRGFGQAGASSMDLRGKGLRTSGVGSSLGGTGTGVASSLAFTPVQGLELVDPKMQAELSRKRKAEEDRWFKGGTFTQVGGADTSGGGGFKKPGQPPSKKVNTGAGMRAPPPPRKT
ncbi:Pleckstrin-like proteiny domain-containing family A member 8 [Verticillium dahliae VDG2]|nr:Pleckstrin-like proteiny domain-containing family A member 8 [Verticillium dahliae VDG2]